MKFRHLPLVLLSSAALAALAACAWFRHSLPSDGGMLATQVAPQWTASDLDFFLHGSMSTEIVPERVLRAFFKTYPDLFPTDNFSHIGAIPDPQFGWPVGFSRAKPAHLGGQSSVGINCAACHTAQFESPAGAKPVSVLGVTAQFDAEAYFGSIIGATFRTREPENIWNFLLYYLDENDPQATPEQRTVQHMHFAALWQVQSAQILAALAADPAGANGTGPGGLQAINPAELELTNHSIVQGQDLAALCTSLLHLFHNMRAALHIPDAPPSALPPASGPGRNDAFGTLSAGLVGVPQPYAPVKFGVVWNVGHRPYVHWDANTRSPLARNLLAAVGLGAPMIGHKAVLDFKALKRHTALTELIAPPKYPYPIDSAAAARGAQLYRTECAACHDGAETDARLFGVQTVGTDPLRATLFTQHQADLLNGFLAELQTPGYTPPSQPGIRSTQKYWASSLAGVWARAPYLHNGSVRTMQELLTPPAQRAAAFHRGSRIYDQAALGFADTGYYLLDTRTPANSNAGHDYGTKLTGEQKRDLIEYLKTL